PHCREGRLGEWPDPRQWTGHIRPSRRCSQAGLPLHQSPHLPSTRARVGQAARGRPAALPRPRQPGCPSQWGDGLGAGIEVPLVIDAWPHAELDGHGCAKAARVVENYDSLNLHILALVPLGCATTGHFDIGVSRGVVSAQDGAGITTKFAGEEADSVARVLVERDSRTNPHALARAFADAPVYLQPAPSTGHSRSQAACGSRPSSDGRDECRGGTREGRTRPTSLRAT